MSDSKVQPNFIKCPSKITYHRPETPIGKQRYHSDPTPLSFRGKILKLPMTSYLPCPNLTDLWFMRFYLVKSYRSFKNCKRSLFTCCTKKHLRKYYAHFTKEVTAIFRQNTHPAKKTTGNVLVNKDVIQHLSERAPHSSMHKFSRLTWETYKVRTNENIRIFQICT